jgi:hypothetical protein
MQSDNNYLNINEKEFSLLKYKLNTGCKEGNKNILGFCCISEAIGYSIVFVFKM